MMLVRTPGFIFLSHAPLGRVQLVSMDQHCRHGERQGQGAIRALPALHGLRVQAPALGAIHIHEGAPVHPRPHNQWIWRVEAESHHAAGERHQHGPSLPRKKIPALHPTREALAAARGTQRHRTLPAESAAASQNHHVEDLRGAVHRDAAACSSPAWLPPQIQS